MSLAPGDAERERLLNGIELALTGQRLATVPTTLQSWFAKAWQRQRASPGLVRLGLRIGNPEATETALRLATDQTAPEAERVGLIEVLGQIREPNSLPSLLNLFEQSKSAALRNAALSALQHFPDQRIPEALVEAYPRLDKDLRQRARNAMCSRVAWAPALLDAVDLGRIAPAELGFDQLRQIVSLNDAKLAQRVEKRWGKVASASTADKENTINRLRLVLNPSGAAGRRGLGDPAAGKQVFQQTCGLCHRLFGEGNTLGPDLTGADRKNTEQMLLNIVNPNAYIRPEYIAYDVVTKDDQTLSGLMTESSPASVTLLDRNNQRHVLARDQLKELNPSPLSLMPEGLLEALTPEQVMNLFAYLQGEEPASSHLSGK